jgi:TetR/AcrR family transcriptional repressor of bet genes
MRRHVTVARLYNNAINTGSGKPAVERKAFRREAEETRREALIAATLELVGEGGASAATSRAIAQRAGVTPGLIRHYFTSKEELLRAAYRALIEGMNARVLQAVEAARAEGGGAGSDRALCRLAAFVCATLAETVAAPEKVSRWSGFLHRFRADPELSEAHWAGYESYRQVLQNLIGDLLRPGCSAAQIEAEAIACNALLDGLWLELSLLPGRLDRAQFQRIGLTSVGALLAVDLCVYEKEHRA